jgi:hypothetical protein
MVGVIGMQLLFGNLVYRYLQLYACVCVHKRFAEVQLLHYYTSQLMPFLGCVLLSSCNPAASIILLLLLLLPGTMSHMPPELLRYGRMSTAVSSLYFKTLSARRSPELASTV